MLTALCETSNVGICSSASAPSNDLTNNKIVDVTVVTMYILVVWIR